jgi:D-serine deaminase-like pyridoxal phosphate-dependent protein
VIPICEVQTPAILIDLDVMDRNLARVADYSREHGLRLRPHTKTHKIPALGRRQIEGGAVGLTVAKVSEAEVMLQSGAPDLLIAYPVIGRPKLERLMHVAAQTAVTVSLDSVEAAKQLSAAAQWARREIGVLAELDAGLGRVGVTPGRELIELARAIGRLPGLRLDGIAFYPGHIKMLDEEGHQAIQALGELIRSVLRELRWAGLAVSIVSGGSTPALFESHRIAGLNEIRPGTYIFNDRNTMLMGACTLDECAASIMTTVVSTARPGQIIIDGGSKTFSSDRPASGDVSFGHIVEAPDAVFTKMNEEHGYVDVRSVDRRFAVGDHLRVIPNHICVAMNLHECVYGIRGDRVEQVWRVEGRGKLQ